MLSEDVLNQMDQKEVCELVSRIYSYSDSLANSRIAMIQIADACKQLTGALEHSHKIDVQLKDKKRELDEYEMKMEEKL